MSLSDAISDESFYKLLNNFQTRMKTHLFQMANNTLTDGSQSIRVSSSSGSSTLPKPSLNKSSDNSNTLPKPKSDKSKDDSSSGKSTKVSKPSKKKKGGKSKSKRPRMAPFESIGTKSQELTGELNHAQEGLDVNILQQICDDGNPQVMEEASSYFVMRHNLSFPGPFSIMMQGPAALTSYGWRVGAEAVHKDKYVVVGNYGNGVVEGIWEHTWSPAIKSHLNFGAGWKTAQQEQMEAMMGGGGPSFPFATGYLDFKFYRTAWKLRCDMMTNELSASFHGKVNSNLSVGTRIGTCYDSRKSFVEFGAAFKYGKSLSKNKKKHHWEVMLNKDSNFLQGFYTNHISDQASLTARLMYKIGATDRIMSAFGYKYQFGKSMGASKTIVGEISSDGLVRQSITLPILQNMIMKAYGEMHHFITSEQLQRGAFPHKYGVSLQIHV